MYKELSYLSSYLKNIDQSYKSEWVCIYKIWATLKDFVCSNPFTLFFTTFWGSTCYFLIFHVRKFGDWVTT